MTLIPVVPPEFSVALILVIDSTFEPTRD